MPIENVLYKFITIPIINLSFKLNFYISKVAYCVSDQEQFVFGFLFFARNAISGTVRLGNTSY